MKHPASHLPAAADMAAARNQEADMADPETPDPEADKDPAPDSKPTANDDADKWKALARKHEKQAKELADRLQGLEDKDKTELQRLQDTVAERDAQLANLPREARSQAIRFASKATQAGFLDPEDALTFLGNDVDLADDTAVKAALDELAARKPHLVRQQPAKKLPTRPKPKPGADGGEESADGGLQGKERAAAALRQFRNT